jgi:hypothetical protein
MVKTERPLKAKRTVVSLFFVAGAASVAAAAAAAAGAGGASDITMQGAVACRRADTTDRVAIGCCNCNQDKH